MIGEAWKRYREQRKQELEREFLPAMQEIEESPPAPLGRLTLWIVVVLTLIVVMWSWLGKIDEVATTQGKFIPAGRVQTVQAVEQGVIRTIHIVEGEVVQPGQLLIELDPSLTEADVQGQLKEKYQLLLEIDRLEAELRNDVSHILETEWPELRNERDTQQRLLTARIGAYEAKLRMAELTLQQRQSQREAAQTAKRRLEITVEQLQSEQARLKPLVDMKALPREKLTQTERQLVIETHELQSQNSVIQQAQEAWLEAQKGITSLQEDRRRELFEELTERRKRLDLLDTELTKNQQRQSFQKLVSPIGGTVLKLRTHTEGAVVQPAETLIEIVPSGTELMVEAWLLNKDIGFVREGMEVSLKVETFPFQKYGTLDGLVKHISADSIEHETFGWVYQVHIVKPVDRPPPPGADPWAFPVGGRFRPVSTGMNVTAEVKTGKRRVIMFFLDPLVKTLDESLSIR